MDRGTNGVTATLPNAGQTATGGQTGSQEQDTIRPGIGTLVGSNGNDILTGSNGADQIAGVAPAGTPGVAPGLPGNDALNGGAGSDVLLGAGGNDSLTGGPGGDVFLAAAGNDLLRTRDGTVESPSCGTGADLVAADATDKPASDCEMVNTGASSTPPATQTPGTTTPRLHHRGGHDPAAAQRTPVGARPPPRPAARGAAPGLPQRDDGLPRHPGAPYAPQDQARQQARTALPSPGCASG